MAATRILLVRDGDFYIHLQQLAELLSQQGYDVEVLHTANAPPEPLYRDLIAKTRSQDIICHLVHGRGSWLEQRLIALAFRLGAITTGSVITPFKIRTARRLIAGRRYDAILAYDPASLLLASRLFPNRLARIIDYSLEVSDESHADFQTSRVERELRLFERSMLPKIGALLIQDRFRAKVLLQHVPDAARVKTIYMPVAINGPARPWRAQPHSPFTVLFFGGLWSTELLGELETIARALRDGQRLRIQGGRGTVRPSVSGEHLEISTEPVPFERVNDVIADADIGLAVYPQAEANSRCSAFAGEKVARYLQCGIPFIAFDNEDYAFLRAQTGCCELVRTYDEIPGAINTMMDHYERYQQGARLAFEKYYWRGASAAALLRYLESLPSST